MLSPGSAGDLYATVGADISPLEAAFARAGQVVSRFAGSFEGASAKIKAAASDISAAGGAISKYVTLPVTLLGGAALKTAGDMDALRRGLAAVLPVGADLQAELAKLRDVAKLPGLGLQEAIQGSIRLQAVGVSAELARKALLAFGNAIATTGGGKSELNRVTEQLGQLAAKGKVLSQDLRPIIEAAPATAQALRKLYGTVDASDISDKLAEQGKSSQDFVEILTTELGKLPKVTGGLKNAFENFGDASTIALDKLGTAINKNFDVEGKLGAVGEVLNNLVERFTAADPATQKLILGFVGVAAAAGPVLLAVGAIGAALPAIGAGFAALVSPVGLAVAAVVAAGAGLAYYVATSKTATQAFDDQKNKVKNLSDNLAPLLFRYDDLKAKSALSTAESKELHDIIQQIATVLPESARGFRENGEAIDVSTAAGYAYLAAQQQILAVKNRGALNEQRVRYRELALAIKDVTAQLNNVNAQGEVIRAGKAEVDQYGKAWGDAAFSVRLTNEEVAELRAKQAAFNAERAGVAGFIRELKGIPPAAKEAGDAVADAAAKITAKLTPLEKAFASLAARLKANSALSNGLAELGQQYDFVSTQAGILEEGIKGLIARGADPGSASIKRYTAELARLQFFLQEINRIPPPKLLGGVDTSAAGIDPDALKKQIVRALPKKLELPKLKLSDGQSLDDLIDPTRLNDISAIYGTLGESIRKATAEQAVFGKAFDGAAAKAGSYKSAIQGLIAEGIDPMSAQIRALTAEYQANAIEALNTQQTAQIAAAGFAAIGSAAASIGAALGSAAGGQEDFGKAFLKVLAGLAVQIGGIVSAIGVAKNAVAPGSGINSIIAGTALIAIGSAAGAFAAAAGGGRGGSGGSGGSYSPATGSAYSPPISRAAAIEQAPVTTIIKLEGLLRGTDIYQSQTLLIDRLGRVRP